MHHVFKSHYTDTLQSLIWLSLFIIYTLAFHPLRDYPGPWLSQFTRIPYATCAGSQVHWIEKGG